MSRNIGEPFCPKCGHYFGDDTATPENMKTLQAYLDELGYDKFHVYRDNWGYGWCGGGIKAWGEPSRDITYIADVHCPDCGTRYALWVWREFTNDCDHRSAVYHVEDMSYYETFNDEP